MKENTWILITYMCKYFGKKIDDFFSFFKIGKLFEVFPLLIAIEKENYPMGLYIHIV